MRITNLVLTAALICATSVSAQNPYGVPEFLPVACPGNFNGGTMAILGNGMVCLGDFSGSNAPSTLHGVLRDGTLLGPINTSLPPYFSALASRPDGSLLAFGTAVVSGSGLFLSIDALSQEGETTGSYYYGQSNFYVGGVAVSSTDDVYVGSQSSEIFKVGPTGLEPYASGVGNNTVMQLHPDESRIYIGSGSTISLTGPLQGVEVVHTFTPQAPNAQSARVIGMATDPLGGLFITVREEVGFNLFISYLYYMDTNTEALSLMATYSGSMFTPVYDPVHQELYVLGNGNIELAPCSNNARTLYRWKLADCFGVIAGSAFLDDCNACVGGTTGEVACVADCNGVLGGTATLDNCETCVGGNTGLLACVADCNGAFGGTALVGTACDDGDPNTGGDVYGIDCTCAGTTCAGTPTPGNTTGPNSICSGIPFTLALQNTSTAPGITYQWESSADGSTWTPAPITNTTYTASQTTPTWYRCQVTCSGSTGTSTPLHVSMENESVCGRNALSFDGVNDRVDLGNPTSLAITGNTITLEAWIYPTAWKNQVWEGTIINTENDDSQTGYMLRCGASGTLNFNIGSGSWNEINSAENVLTLNTWQHVAGTYDGTIMRLYVNGVLVNITALGGFNIGASNNSVVIGDWSFGTGRNFPGKIDEVRIWDVTVPEAQLAENMNSAYCSDEPGLVAYYQFDQGGRDGNNASLTTLLDLSPNANHGTLSGFTLMGTTSNWVEGRTNMTTCGLFLCTGTPTPGNTTGPNSICSDVPFTLGLQNTSTAPGITYQWESSADGSTWTNAPGTNATYAASQTTSTWYRCQVTCSGSTGTSTPLQISLENESVCVRNALSFDGVNDRVNCGEGPSVDITGNAITMEAWVYPTAWKTNFWEGGIINKESANGGGLYTLRAGNGGRVNVALGGSEVTTPTTVLALNAWQHVAATYDGSTVKIFVNGTQVYQAAKSGAIASSPGFPLCIGNSFAYPDRGFSGKIDEVRIWNITVPAGQIAAHLNTAYCSDEPGPVAYYQFDQGVRDGNNAGETTLLDLSPNANHGTLSGFTLTGTTSNWVAGQTNMTACVILPCAGTPTPGNTAGPTIMCPGVPFTLGLQNPSTGSGITYQWERSANGSTWTNAPGTSTHATYAASQTATTWYRCQVTCSQNTGTSTALQVGLNTNLACQTYCNNVFFGYVEPICNVTFAGIDNPSDPTGSSPYEDFMGTVAPAQVLQGSTYTISVTGNTMGDYTNYFTAFFDWDRNGTFETLVPIGSIVNTVCGTVVSATVTVPQYAVIGTSRMRIIKAYEASPTNPCHASYYTYGQGEDYLVEVSPMACDMVVLNITTDGNPGQITWEITDATNTVIASGAPNAANQLVSEMVCLGAAPVNGCYGFRLFDSFGDGIVNGGWELRTTDGKLLLRDEFANGSVSPAAPAANPNYGSSHSFCLPAGPGNIAPTECGIFDNLLGNKVYANKVTGASNYQFEFSDPDAGFMRRIARPYNYVHFWDMLTNPLTPGVKYFARVRTDRDGAMASAHFGSGCEMGIAMETVACTQLIPAPSYGHSCNEIRTFNTNNSFIWATPVQGATEYQFRITNTQEGYDQTFTRSTYILQLKWNNTVAPPLISGYTYAVSMNVKVNGLYSGFCTSACNITIDNSGNRPEASMTQAMGAATLWPNPVRDGQVNLNIDGLVDAEQNITVDIQDVYGKQVFAKEFGNSGERFNTILDLPGDIANGVYMVNITVNGKSTVQRLSIVR